MREFILRSGMSFEELSQQMNRLYGNSNPMIGVMGKAFRYLMCQDLSMDLMMPVGVTNNTLYNLYSDELGVRLIEMQVRLVTRNRLFDGRLQLQENLITGKFRVDLTLTYGDVIFAKHLNTVLSRCELTGVAVRFNTDSSITLTSDGLTAMCNLLNAIASYRESLNINDIRIVSPYVVSGLV